MVLSIETTRLSALSVATSGLMSLTTRRKMTSKTSKRTKGQAMRAWGGAKKQKNDALEIVISVAAVVLITALLII